MKKFLILALISLAMLSSISCAGSKKAEKDDAKTAKAKAEWLAFDQAMEKAAADKKYVVVDFYTDWCKWCKVMDDKTYADPSVVTALKENFVIAKINGESPEKITYRGKTMSQSDFTMSMQVSGFPTTMFLASDGTVIGKIPGYIEAPVFKKILEYLTSGSYKSTSLDQYLSGKK
ncbi:MAG: DUF255 domain-containing protein [bacterium]|nr:DUF255 domain-containing protein [bacterium]